MANGPQKALQTASELPDEGLSGMQVAPQSELGGSGRRQETKTQEELPPCVALP